MRKTLIQCDRCSAELTEDHASQLEMKLTGRPGNQISKELELDLCDDCAGYLWGALQRKRQESAGTQADTELAVVKAGHAQQAEWEIRTRSLDQPGGSFDTPPAAAADPGPAPAPPAGHCFGKCRVHGDSSLCANCEAALTAALDSLREARRPHGASPIALYRMFLEHVESEGLGCQIWDDLDPREMIAWGKLYRQLMRDWLHLKP